MTQPAPEIISMLLNLIEPGSVLISIHEAPGSFSNSTHIIEASGKDGQPFRIVARRYAEFGGYDRGEKARREYHTFELLNQFGVASPKPLYQDADGGLFGVPGIVTAWIPGKLLLEPPYPSRWAETLAAMLAHIHAINVTASQFPFLLNANEEALWFLNAERVMPEYIRAHPLGIAVWNALTQNVSQLTPIAPALVHLDYWSRNILWEDEQITGVIDWEEAAYGDPGIDVAYCLMELALNGLENEAVVFLNRYQTAAGRQVANLAFWELAAAVRPMVNPAGWIDESPAKERFAQFINRALENISDPEI